MSTYTQGLIIDGVSYDIPLISVKRTFDFLEKYAERTEDGDIKIETIGGYQNYQIKVGALDDFAAYGVLFSHITDVTNRFHTVVLPDSVNTFTFYGYFSSIEDEFDMVLDNGVKMKGLSFNMTEKKPTRTP